MANYIHRNEVALELSKSAAALMIEDMKLVLQPDVEGSWLEPPEISDTDTDNSNDKTEEVGVMDVCELEDKKSAKII